MNYHLSTTWIIVLIVAAIWEIVWKAIALWKSARHKQLGWFVAILILNTAGLLPIAYLLFANRVSQGSSD